MSRTVIGTTQYRSTSGEVHLAGLRRRVLGQTDVGAQSLSATAPALAMAGGPVVVSVAAGGAALLAFMIGMGVMLLVAYCVNQFTRRIASTGSLYTFVARGIGPRAGILSGCGLIIGYGFVAAATLLSTSEAILESLRRFGLFGHAPRAGALIIVTFAVAALAGTSLVSGIGASTRIAVTVQIVSVLGIVVLAVVILSRTHATIDPGQLLTSTTGVQGVLVGVGMAVTMFVGFESAASLGVEARKPFRTVPRAITGTVLFAGCVFIFCAFVENFGVRTRPTGGPVLRDSTLASLAAEIPSGLVQWLIIVAVAAAGFCCLTSTVTALVRLVFTLSREGILFRRLGRTSAGGTPTVAIASIIGLISGPPIMALALGTNAQVMIAQLIAVGTFGYLLSYTVVCVAAPMFLHRIGELSARVIVAGAIAGVLMIGTYAASLEPMHGAIPTHVAWYFAALAATITTVCIGVSRGRSSGIENVGLFDQAQPSDFFSATNLENAC
jgi:amino acid transporter